MIPNSYGHDINMKFNRNESIKAYKQNPVNNNLIRIICQKHNLWHRYMTMTLVKK